MSSRPPQNRRAQRRRRQASSNKWLWWAIGGSVGAIAVVIIILYAAGVFSSNSPGNIDNNLSSSQFQQLIARSHMEGSASAPVTMIEFGDFQCPYCEQFWAGPLQTVLSNYLAAGTVRFGFHHMAFIGDESKRAAEASECAADQGKFFEYYNTLYQNQHKENTGYLTTDQLLAFGQDIGLDMGPFTQCVQNRTYKDKVVQDTAYATSLGVHSTPTVLVNGKVVSNPLSTATLLNAIDAAKTGSN